jgi:hypothetical protein
MPKSVEPSLLRAISRSAQALQESNCSFHLTDVAGKTLEKVLATRERELLDGFDYASVVAPSQETWPIRGDHDLSSGNIPLACCRL